MPASEEVLLLTELSFSLDVSHADTGVPGTQSGAKAFIRVGARLLTSVARSPVWWRPGTGGSGSRPMTVTMHTPAHQQTGRRLRLTAAITAVSGLVCLLGGCRTDTSWRVIDSPGTALQGMRFTHAAAGAWVVRYHGIDGPEMDNTQFVAAMRLYMGRSECPSCPADTIWDIAGGMRDFLQVKDRSDIPVRERFRYSGNASETAEFEEYVQAIDGDQPVILTFCYDPAAAEDTVAASLRTKDCFSVVGIGYLLRGSRRFLICHDGFAPQPVPGGTAEDRVAPDRAGVGDQRGPWNRPGTALYKWDGDYRNLIMVFVDA